MLVAVLCAGVESPAYAQEDRDALECASERGPRQTVTGVVDGETLALADGTEVRLVGLLAPKIMDTPAGTGVWPLADAARAALSTLVLGSIVELRFAGRRSDRWGRVLAQALVISTAPRPQGEAAAAQLETAIWVQGAQLKAGLARVYALAESTGCLTEMLSEEAAARNGRIGLWADPAYATRSADKTGELRRLRGTYQIIEGSVSSLHSSAGRTYLNFGARQRGDFWIGVASQVRRGLTGRGVDVRQLEGRTVQARGWIELQNGPTIAVSDARQLDVLGADATEIEPSGK